MGTTLTPTKLIGTLILVLAFGALLVPSALARTVDGEPGTLQLGSPVYGPDAFERAVIANQVTLGDYRDAGHTVARTSGAMVYPDAAERSQHLLRFDTPTSSSAPSDGSFDWGLLAMLASVGGIAVLGAAALIGVRQRTRLA
jgi:hypothetical protein